MIAIENQNIFQFDIVVGDIPVVQVLQGSSSLLQTTQDLMDVEVILWFLAELEAIADGAFHWKCAAFILFVPDIYGIIIIEWDWLNYVLMV